LTIRLNRLQKRAKAADVQADEQLVVNGVTSLMSLALVVV
jgi:hypothetical protein